MKYSANVFFFVLLVFMSASFTSRAQVSEVPLFPISSITSYSNFPVNELNRAHRQALTGQFEVALLTYNSTLAFQPNWVPALTARAELLYRLGRDLEAKRDKLQAQRTDPMSTAFFLSRGQNGLLPFLALYPRDWYEDQYGFAKELNLPGGAPLTPQAYFTHQYFKITEATNTDLAVELLRKKVASNTLASRRILESLPRDYNPSVRNMLAANLAMLNHDYPAAIELYNDAENRVSTAWPEIRYNRGLGYILLNDYMNGCRDLSSAARSGFAPASTMYNCLCEF